MSLQNLRPGELPERSEKLPRERVIHLHLENDADPQLALQEATESLGPTSRLCWTRHAPEEVRQWLIEQASVVRPTLVFMQLQQPGIVTPETIDAVRAAVADPRLVVACWNGDIAGANSVFTDSAMWQVELGNACDLSLYASEQSRAALASAGLRTGAYLQIGFENQWFTPAGAPDEKRYDVVFLGNRYDESFYASQPNAEGELRHAMVERLQKRFGKRAGIFGNYTGQHVTKRESAAVYRDAQAAVSISLISDGARTTSGRLFNALGSGVAVFAKRFPDHEGLGLRHGQNVLLWDTLDELDALLDEWLPRPELRALGLEGARLAHGHHTWHVRMRELAVLLDRARGESRCAPYARPVPQTGAEDG